MQFHIALLISALGLLTAAPAQPANTPASTVFTRQYAKLSPFSGLRWKDESPEVMVGETWYSLLSIDGIEAAEIVTFCKQEEGRRWQKRFGEDLVEMLSRMGQKPGKQVDLELLSLEDGKKVSLADVAMTRANRQAIWASAHRDRDRPPAQAPVRRVQREHGEKIRSVHRFLESYTNADLSGASGMLTRKQAEEDLDQLEWHIVNRFSYRDRLGVDYRSALDAVRASLRDEVARADFALQLVKFIGLFGDGHSRVQEDLSRILPVGYTPYLVEQVQGGVVAFEADRQNYLSHAHPYLEQLDNIDIEDWLKVTARLNPAGSPQFVRRQALRNLRYLGWARLELGSDPSAPVGLYLTAEGHKRSFLNEVELEDEKPTYGAWPGGSHQRISDVGYLRIPRMSNEPEVIEELVEKMEEFQDTKALIIDVRGNGGGTRDILRLLGGYLLAPEQPARVVNVAAYRLDEGDDPHAAQGYLQNRFLHPAASSVWSDDERAAIAEVSSSFEPEWSLPEADFSDWHYMVLSRDPKLHTDHYDRPVIVLMDGGCFSATDIFLGALKGVSKVTLMGAASGGGSGRSQSLTLQHSGIRMRLSSMASFQLNGHLYDGNGIQPDVLLLPIKSDLINETDSVLDAALARCR